MSRIDEKPVALPLAFQASIASEKKSTAEIRNDLKLDARAHRTVDQSIVQITRELFFGQAARISATLGRVHPGLPKGSIHPSTSDALQSLLEGLDFNKASFVPEIRTKTLEGSASVFGGPVANLHARLILGCGEKSPLFGVQPPVTFLCPKSSAGTAPLKSPWKVLVGGRASSAECLVITSLPMDDGNDRLTVFSGLHGAGTRAIKLLLSDERRLSELLRQTRQLRAWQTLIEVQSKDSNIPIALGEVNIFEFSEAENFSSVRHKLFMSPETIRDLMVMLPSKYFVDLSDPDNTGVIQLKEHRLYKARLSRRIEGARFVGDGSLSRAERAKNESVSKGAVLRRRGGSKHGPQMNTEAKMAHRSELVSRPPGRPAKAQSDAVLTRRLQILLSPEDVERIQSVMEMTAAPSMGEVIRAAVKATLERLEAKGRRRRH